jgi:hypothetical protein
MKMRIIVIALANSLLFLSCQHQRASSEVVGTSFDFNGTWVNVDYLTTANEAKSALAAYKTFQIINYLINQ